MNETDYLNALNRGETAFGRGDLRSATAHFQALLTQIEAQPPGAAIAPGSYQHSLILHWLARCLHATGQPTAAEPLLETAFTIIDKLIAAHPTNQAYQRERSGLLIERGNLQTFQGYYTEAHASYDEALTTLHQLGGDPRSEGVIWSQLGLLALQQQHYTEAERHYTASLRIDQSLNDRASEAITWHQLGRVAQEQRNWLEAERCYRASLALKEQLGMQAGLATSYNQLAIVASSAGRPHEAEAWFQRALAIDENVGNDQAIARDLSNLAVLLLEAITAQHLPPDRLVDARRHSERALAIIEQLNDPALEPWKDYRLAAEIALLEARAADYRHYRQRERVTYAAHPAHRQHIDRHLSPFIAAIVTATQGDWHVRAGIEAALPQWEASGWHISAAVQRIWNGERNWEALVEELEPEPALLVLRMLEELEKAA